MVHSMLNKTLIIHIKNLYLAITDDEQYYACQGDMDILK